MKSSKIAFESKVIVIWTMITALTAIYAFIPEKITIQPFFNSLDTIVIKTPLILLISGSTIAAFIGSYSLLKAISVAEKKRYTEWFNRSFDITIRAALLVILFDFFFILIIVIYRMIIMDAFLSAIVIGLIIVIFILKKLKIINGNMKKNKGQLGSIALVALIVAIIIFVILLTSGVIHFS